MCRPTGKVRTLTVEAPKASRRIRPGVCFKLGIA